MILIDNNLLMYAISEHFPQHRRANAWLSEVLSGTETVGLPWIVLLGFIRVTTRSGIFSQPFTPHDAFRAVREWVSHPLVTIPAPTSRHLETLAALLEPTGTAGNLTMDAHLAALAIEHGAEVCSADYDFGRFRGLRWRNPLVDN